MHHQLILKKPYFIEKRAHFAEKRAIYPQNERYLLDFKIISWVCIARKHLIFPRNRCFRCIFPRNGCILCYFLTNNTIFHIFYHKLHIKHIFLNISTKSGIFTNYVCLWLKNTHFTPFWLRMVCFQQEIHDLSTNYQENRAHISEYWLIIQKYWRNIGPKAQLAHKYYTLSTNYPRKHRLSHKFTENPIFD